MVSLAIPVAEDAILEFCQRNGIRRLALFGSILREDFNEGSDVDVLVDFMPDVSVGWRVINIEDELSALFGGRKVDMVRTKALNPRLRDSILSSAQVLYDQG